MRGLGEIYKRDDLKSPFYWMKYYDAAGKRRRQTTGTTDKNLAEKILINRIREFDSLRNGLKIVTDMPYDVFTKDFLRHYRARYGGETLKSHTSAVNEFKRYLDTGIKLSDITPAIINRYITYRREVIKNKTTTCNNHIKCLHRQFEWAIENDLMSANGNPANRKKVKRLEVTDAKEKEYLTSQEYALFMQICKKQYPFYYPIFYVYFHTGLRFTEVISQKWNGVDLDKGILWVTKPKGKRKKVSIENDYISIDSGVVETLKALPRTSEYVFVDERGQPFVARTRKFIRRLKTILKMAGIDKKCNLHTTRHSHCKYLFDAGLNTAEVQRQMRHTELRTTQRYTHIFRPEINKKIEKLKKLDRIGT